VIEMVRCRLWAGVLALVAMAVFAASASASTSSPSASRDAASARAFVRSELKIDQATVAHSTAEQAAGRAYVASVAAACPDSTLTIPTKLGTKKGVVLIGFLLEVASSYETQVLAPIRPAVGRIASVQQRLRFSDPTLQWQVHGSTSALAAMLSLTPPDLCADARQLASSHLTKLTPASTRFIKNMSPLLAGQVGSASPGALMRRMRPYAPGAVTAGLKRFKTLDKQISHRHIFRSANRLFTLFFGKTKGFGTDGRWVRAERHELVTLMS
jgi:hypothetical protein